MPTWSMKTTHSLLTSFLLIASSSTFSADLSGMRFPETIQIEGQRLVLNGAALRTWGMFRVYAIALYVNEDSKSKIDPINTDGMRRVSLVLLRDTKASELAEALREGIKENHSDEAYNALLPRIQQLISMNLSFGSAPEGSQVNIDYLPNRGTRFSFNDQLKGEPIPGADFYQSILRIWLGPKPPMHSIKEALLGKINAK